MKVFNLKSFRLFAEAIKTTRHEMWVSVQVLIAATLVLSLLLFAVEHNAQPDVFSNYWDALLWSFMGYIGDPGDFATYTPITFWGRILKILCAIINIAIFAVPAGLVAGGFGDAIARDQREKELQEMGERLACAFRRRQDRYTKFRTVPRYVSPVDVQAMQQMDTKDIIDAVRASKQFRLRNLAAAQPESDHPLDRLIIEEIPTEGLTSYGCCIDRRSKVTIVAPSSVQEPAIGHFAYHVALYGGFNYISKEYEEDSNLPRSYYLIDNTNPTLAQQDYLADLRRLSEGEDRWVIFLISSESVHPEQLHFVTLVQKKIGDRPSTIIQTEAFDRLFESIQTRLHADYQVESERDTRYLPAGPKNVAMQIDGGKRCNAFTIRTAWSVTAFDTHHIAIARALAEQIGRTLLPDWSDELDPRWKEPGIGYLKNTK
jgi:voltage-gated potassium channel